MFIEISCVPVQFLAPTLIEINVLIGYLSSFTSLSWAFACFSEIMTLVYKLNITNGTLNLSYHIYLSVTSQYINIYFPFPSFGHKFLYFPTAHILLLLLVFIDFPVMFGFILQSQQ